MGKEIVVDTTSAVYVWEHDKFPVYYVPLADVATGQLSTDALVTPKTENLRDLVKVKWDAVDAWYEEDEEVFVHPRNPYARVDALRSTRQIRVELDGVVLAESNSPVLVFETGLPTRYYLNQTDVNFQHLDPSDTVTSCPYKGTTTGYWSCRTKSGSYPDLAWSYAFPTRELLPIAGLIAFYNEKVDLILGGKRLERPRTPFS
jgi:uncharacterized protein (DUF427 family)